MFLDNIKLIVKMNKERELGKWLFNPNYNFELIEDREDKPSVQNLLMSLKEKISNAINA